MAELNVAMAVLAILLACASAPMAFEQRYIRQAAVQGNAMEIVDGEAEILAAGAWRKFGSGEFDYPVSYESAKSLPPGRFVLLVTDDKVRLEWRSKLSDGREATRVVREFSK